MKTERFLALVAAYGADPRRWPEAERSAAEALVAAAPMTVRDALVEADLTDGLLHASRVRQPSTALRDRVIASAAEAGLRAGRQGRRWLDRLTLTLGAGWAAAACAGVAAGLILTSQIISDLQVESVLYEASLFEQDGLEMPG
jgi:hypothetical protein